MAYIFDLDQTIVDSSVAEIYRRQREWQKVYSLIPNFTLYKGIGEVLDILRGKGEKICVVTSSPKKYCNAVLDYFGIEVDCTVCYHDTKLHKPNPEPIIKAMELLDETSQSIISIGDAENDVIASNAAGVTSCLACWGRQGRNTDVAADYKFGTVEELKKYIIT